MKIQYNNLYTHFIFTTYLRESILLEKYRNRVEKYITGIVNNNSSKMYAIYVNPEHAHFLVSRAPHISEQTLATIIENSSEKFINENKLFIGGKFSWQSSASAFSVSKADVDKVCKYIIDQPIHHKKTTFIEEYEYFIRHYQATLNINK